MKRGLLREEADELLFDLQKKRKRQAERLRTRIENAGVWPPALPGSKEGERC